MSLVLLLKFVKFAGLIGWSAGAGAALLSTDRDTRRRGAHGLASPALVVVWLAGVALAHDALISLSALWIVAAFVASTASQLALSVGVGRGSRSWTWRAAVVVPFLTALAFMVMRPNWGSP